MADHHARLAVEARETAHDRGVVGVRSIAVQLAKVGEQRVDVVERVGSLRMARDLRNLPSRQLAVDLFGKELALFRQPRDLVGNIDGRILVDVAELVDLLLKLGDRLLEVEKGLLHARSESPGRMVAQLALGPRRGRALATGRRGSAWQGGCASDSGAMREPRAIRPAAMIRHRRAENHGRNRAPSPRRSAQNRFPEP